MSVRVNGAASEWSDNQFQRDFNVFNKDSIVSVIAALMLTLGVNGPSKQVWCIMCARLWSAFSQLFDQYIRKNKYVRTHSSIIFYALNFNL